MIDKVVDEPVKSKEICHVLPCSDHLPEERKEFAGRGRGRGVIGNRGGGNQGGGGRGQVEIVHPLCSLYETFLSVNRVLIVEDEEAEEEEEEEEEE